MFKSENKYRMKSDNLVRSYEIMKNRRNQKETGGKEENISNRRKKRKQM